MKNVYLSLNYSPENDELIQLVKSDETMNVVDLETTEENDVSVIVNGPLTEVANLLLNNWTLRNKIKQILFVGGTDKYGDVTPVAEKNVYADVYSAQQVFLSRIPIVMFGLNTTRDLENRVILPYAYLKDDTIFETEECGVYVETKGTVTKGMSVIDIYSDRQFEHHDVLFVKKIDFEKLEKVLGE